VSLNHHLAPALVAAGLLSGALVALLPLLLWWEDRLTARIQGRRGRRPGPVGVLWPLATSLARLSKAEALPPGGDAWAFRMAPVFALLPAALLALLALASATRAADVELGLLYVLALAAAISHGPFLAGWAGGSARTRLGAIRAVGERSAAFLSLGLCLAAAASLHGTGDLSQLGQAQAAGALARWNLWVQPLGFVTFVVSAIVLVPGSAFGADAGPDLGGGVSYPYSGPRRGLVELARAALLLAMALIGAQLYLGGAHAPGLPSGGGSASVYQAPIVLGIKALAMASILVWARASLYRVPARRLTELGWKVLVPLAALNLAWTALAAAWLE
jgi:NADH-quinone oxidoreductase subunit H